MSTFLCTGDSCVGWAPTAILPGSEGEYKVKAAPPPPQSDLVSFNTWWEDLDSDWVRDADANATVTFLTVMDREVRH